MNRLIINSITFSRLLILPLVYFYPSPLFLFLSASWCGISDFLDGYLAKRLNSKSNFGIKLDQIADKIVALYFFIELFTRGQIAIWFIILFFLREGLILIGRNFGLNIVDSNSWGKLKTVFVYVFIGYVYCNNYLQFFTSLNSKWISFIFQICILAISFYSYYISLINSFKNKLNYFFIKLIASSFFTAYIFKRMPGTSSSIIVFPLFYFFQDIQFEIKITIIGLFILLHYLVCPLFSKQIGKDDPGEYTLDETIAIAFCWLPPFHSLQIWILYFVLFRFFDILKPFGIKAFEKSLNFTKATRVVGDDLIAIFYTFIIIYAIEFFIAI
jgi:phosphatidylglycerophosphate synthase/phosphatidylglycerophosphatase A